ncbi:uncharacterized protein METZ01_LOCUS341202, partial [marine metagenome]
CQLMSNTMLMAGTINIISTFCADKIKQMVLTLTKQYQTFDSFNKHDKLNNQTMDKFTTTCYLIKMEI